MESWEQALASSFQPYTHLLFPFISPFWLLVLGEPTLVFLCTDILCLVPMHCEWCIFQPESKPYEDKNHNFPVRYGISSVWLSFWDLEGAYYRVNERLNNINDSSDRNEGGTGIRVGQLWCSCAKCWEHNLCIGLPRWLSSKESTCQCRRCGGFPRSGSSPGGGNSKPLWYSCLRNPMYRRAWQATVHGVAKSQTQLSHWAHTHTVCTQTPTFQPLPLSLWCEKVERRGIFGGKF